MMTRKALALIAIALLGAACQKGTNGATGSTEGNQSSLNCASQSQVDPSHSKIEGPAVAQAGEDASYKLNPDAACSPSSKVIWETSDGQTHTGPSLKAKFPHSGSFWVSAKLITENQGLLSKTSDVTAQVVQNTTVVSSQPVIVGPQMGMIGSPLTFDIAVPTGLTLVSGSWNFGDGSAIQSSLGPITYTYYESGSFNMTVDLRDEAGKTHTLNRTITVTGYYDGLTCLSETKLSGPYDGVAGEPIPFVVRVPSCLTSWVTGATWTFGDGKTATGLPSQENVYTQPGTYIVTVQLQTRLPNDPTLTLTQVVRVSPPPQPTPGPTPVATPVSTPGPQATPNPTPVASPSPAPTPVATPVATPTPVPMTCPSATRETSGAASTDVASCGTGGTKKMNYQTKIVEACSVVNNQLVWTEVSRAKVLVSEGPCEGQSCRLPDGSMLADKASKVMYTSQNPTGACSTVANTRTCDNGTLGGNQNAVHLTCLNGCGDFGPNGTVKTGVITGQTSVAVTCQFNETGVNSVYNQVADQTCKDGKIENSNVRQGSLITAGACPAYRWVPTDSWSQCNANCGGQQTRMYSCMNDKGEGAVPERCTTAKPNETRLCDGDPAAVRRTDTVVTEEDSGATKLCPKNQIGVIVNTRSVTTTKVYACINHAVALESQNVTYGAWITESYCKDYVASRCNQDSLDNNQAQGRYKWMVKCQDQIPAVKEFLAEFTEVKQGKYGIKDSSRFLYPTFMVTGAGKDKVWKAPTSDKASCSAPASIYVAAVCLSSCALPEQEILTHAKADMKMKYAPFLTAYNDKHKFVSTLQSKSSMESKHVVRTKVEQWVTELVDSEHEILVITAKSGHSLKVTPNHPILNDQGMMKYAQDFKVGDNLVEIGGRLDPIVSIDPIKHFGKVYNVFVKSNDLQRNIVLINGYLNGTGFYQNEGVQHLNRSLFRKKLIQGVFAQ